MTFTLGAGNIHRLSELAREYHATKAQIEEVVIEGITMMRVTLWVPDPKQEGDPAPYRFLVSPGGSTVQLGPVREPETPLRPEVMRPDDPREGQWR